MKKSGKKPWSGKLTKRRVIIGAAAVIALIAVVSRMAGGSRETAGDPVQEQKTAVVQRQDITSTLSASGSFSNT